MIEHIDGVILAGGRSRRMGGIVKGLAPLAGKPLIQHVIERFARQVRHLVINANMAEYAHLGLPVIGDLMADFAGPLAGLHVALLRARAPLIAAVPCDAPLLPLNLVARLAGEMGAAPAAVACCGGQMQPTFLLCRREQAGCLADRLRAHKPKMAAWLDEIQAVRVDWDDPQAFANINTPADLAALETTFVQL